MKTIFLSCIIFLFQSLHAQTWNEWFNQDQTKIKYLIDQIATCQVYARYLEKGVAIAKEGLTAIGNIKKGDLSLHQEYFTSLNIVNPTIKNYWKIADIIALQISILKTYHQYTGNSTKSGQFTKDEISYSDRVFWVLIDGCTEILEQLIKITTDGRSQLTDAERIRRIDGLHMDIKDKYAFAHSFSREMKLLELQRMKDQADVKVAGELYGVRQ